MIIAQGDLRALSDAPHDCKMSILLYLTESGVLDCILGLPLLPTIGGNYVSLEHANVGSHRLLTSFEVSLFGTHDLGAIPTDRLPGPLSSIASRLMSDGFNVRPLHSRDVTEYIGMAFSSHGLTVDDHTSHHPPIALSAWLTELWTWAAAQTTQVPGDLLFSMAKSRVLPSASGQLCRASDGVFLAADPFNDLASQAVLEKLGFHFLQPTISPAVVGYLRQANHVRPMSAANVLGKLEVDIVANLDHQSIHQLQSFLSKMPPPSQEHRQLLRALPVFPLLPSGQIVATMHIGSVPQVAAPKLVAHNFSLPLPIFPDICYISDSAVGRALAHAIDPEIITLSDLDILQMALNQFVAQSATVQLSFVVWIAENLDSIPRKLIDTLGQIPFVMSRNGAFLRPTEIVDPSSGVARDLMEPNDPHLPRLDSAADLKMLSSLKILKLVVVSLTPAIANKLIERISDVSSDLASRRTLSKKLLKLMDHHTFDASSVNLDCNLRWLPVEGGELCSPTECRDSIEDDDHPTRSRVLFDMVLKVARISITSPSFRRTLGWESTLPLFIIKGQFLASAAACESIPAPTLERYFSALIREFGRRFRELRAGDLDELRAATVNCRWIPIKSVLCEARYTVFSLDSRLPPFKVFHPSNIGEYEFLCAMGCTERYNSSRMSPLGHASDLVVWYSPSLPAVQDALLSMPKHVGTRALLSQALSLLSYLAPQVDSLSKEERVAVFIIGDDDGLHPIDQVFYNDLGSRAALVALPDEVRLAHRLVTEELARAFSLTPLSSLHITDEAEDDDDMGEALTSRIGGALRQYRPEQMFTEFLANAVDAGSRAMSILLDQMTFPTESILSRSMAQFQTSPALVFHNDAVFTDDDFQGIKRVGTGSKRSRPGRIGRFGLGALSAYHVTEVS